MYVFYSRVPGNSSKMMAINVERLGMEIRTSQEVVVELCVSVTAEQIAAALYEAKDEGGPLRVLSAVYDVLSAIAKSESLRSQIKPEVRGSVARRLMEIADSIVAEAEG